MRMTFKVSCSRCIAAVRRDRNLGAVGARPRTFLDTSMKTKLPYIQSFAGYKCRWNFEGFADATGMMHRKQSASCALISTYR